jgi:ribonuclease HI
MINKIRIFTDGACSCNPGPGGWGAVLLLPERRITIIGYATHTTNNRMELLAVIKALKKADSLGFEEVEIFSDSAYVVDAVNKKWLDNWKKNKWKTSKLEDVKNKDLWIRLDELLSDTSKTISILKVKGHSGNTFNDLADAAATKGVQQAKLMSK